MTATEIRKLCLSLNGTTESIKWDDHLCFSIGDKMYLVVCPDHHPVSSSFKTSESLFGSLTTREGIIPAPYMARHVWVYTDDIKRINKKEWKMLIQTAYDQVFQKLPLKTQKKLKK